MSSKRRDLSLLHQKMQSQEQLAGDATSIMTKSLEAIKQFLQHQTGWTLLFALSHVLFWTSSPILKELNGAYVSGQYGSGIVPVTLTVVIIFSIIWIVKVANALRFALAKES